jgi:hypothetical protein
VNQVTFASLRYPLSVFNKNSTLKVGALPTKNQKPINTLRKKERKKERKKDS